MCLRKIVNFAKEPALTTLVILISSCSFTDFLAQQSTDQPEHGIQFFYPREASGHYCHSSGVLCC